MPNEQIEKKSFSNIRNYLFVLIWIAYFIYYFFWDYKIISTYIIDNIKYWKLILSYINAITAFLTIIWIIWLLNKFLKSIVEQLTKRNKKWIHDVIINYFDRFIRTVKYFIWLYIFTLFINIPQNHQIYYNKFFYIVFLIIFIYYFTNFLNVSFESLLARTVKFKTLNRSLTSFLKKIIIVITWVVWIITILSNIWYNVTALVTWAWIWGLAIALAAQKTLSNVFWAVTVLLTKPFILWDYIKIDGQVWTVKEMWVSHLTMVDKEWYFVLIPNEKLISSNIENLTKRETRRTELSIWVEYKTTLLKTKKAIKILENILEEHKIKEKISSYRVNFDTFWDSSLDIRAVYFSLVTEDYTEYIKQKEEINLKIKEVFTKEKINIAFPTQELIIRK